MNRHLRSILAITGVLVLAFILLGFTAHRGAFTSFSRGGFGAAYCHGGSYGEYSQLPEGTERELLELEREYEDKFEDLNYQLSTTRRDYQDLYYSDSASQAELESLHQEISTLQTELRDLKFEYNLARRDILPEDYRVESNQRSFSQRGHHRGQRGHHRGRGRY